MWIAKKILCLLSFGSFPFCYSQDLVSFKISKPYCLFNFMQTASGGRGTSPSLKKYIDGELSAKNKSFQELVNDYASLRLNYNFRREEIPQSRHPMRSTYDIICNAAVKSADLKDFRERISGLLPNSSMNQLISILSRAEPFYDSIIWNTEYTKLTEQAQKLGSFSGQVSGFFKKLAIFYGTEWNQDFPFIVSLYPIPGKNVTTTATPHGNSLCVGVPVNETDHDRRIAVTVHEMCHVLYDEQPAALQQKLDRYLSGVKSPYQPLAGYYLDEALATACGNGWAKAALSGKPDTTRWYNNEYINGFAHALYETVATYLNDGKRLDSALISNAVKFFADAFPKAIYDYHALLNNIVIYSDAQSQEERMAVTGIITKYFMISSSNFSSPILHEFSINTMRASKSTQLVIIDREHQKTIDSLMDVFPEIKAFIPLNKDDNFVVSFYDKLKRPVIVLRIKDNQALEYAISDLKTVRFFDPERPYQVIK